MEALVDRLRAVLSRFPEIRLCILFGSAASGTAGPGSDLDIAVAAGQLLPAELQLDLVDAFSSAVKREVDLVDLTAVAGPILKQALCKGVVVQNSDKNLYARLISRMLFNQADMMPYYERILRQRREQFLHGQ